MGCSHGKTTKPSIAGVPATSAEAPPTLLSPSRSQKQNDKAPTGDNSVQNVKILAQDQEVATCVDSDALATEVPDSWPLRQKALRVFALADKTTHGLLDANKLAGADGVAVSLDMLQSVIGAGDSGLLSLSTWLESLKKLAAEDEAKTSLFLDLCEKHIAYEKEDWPLRDEALQVFRMGDRNGDGQLDMKELAEIRWSEEAAQTMMDKIDFDKNGVVSKGEWLAYVKRMADHNPKGAAAILGMYRKHLANSNTTADAYDAAKSALDGLVEESSVGPNQRWWACC